MVEETLNDYPDTDNSPAAQYAAEVAKAHITEGTRTGQDRKSVV